MKIYVNGRECAVYSNEACDFIIYSAAESGETLAEVTLEMNVDPAQVKVRPLSAGVEATVEGNTVSLEAKIGSKLSVEFPNSDIKPVFLFLYPKETPIEITPNVRYYAPGEYTEELITLKTGETLYLAEGAILHAQVITRDSENVTICGRGILDITGYPKGKRLVRFHTGKGLTVKDVSLVGAFGWSCSFWGCSDILVDNVNIITWQVTGDGVDIVGSHDVTVRNCFIRACDDCVALKATAYCGEEGLADVYNVKVHDCVFWNAEYGNGIEIGFETRCEEIYNVEFSNIDLIHVGDVGWQSGGAITIHNGDRANVHHIVYRDIRIEDCPKFFDFKVLDSRYSKDAERGVIQDILVDNVSIVDGAFPASILAGFEPENHPVRRVHFRNVSAYGEYVHNYTEGRMILDKTRVITFEVTED